MWRWGWDSCRFFSLFPNHERTHENFLETFVRKGMPQPSQILIGAKARQLNTSVTKHIKSRACSFPSVRTHLIFCPGPKRESFHQREKAQSLHVAVKNFFVFKSLTHSYRCTFQLTVESSEFHRKLDKCPKCMSLRVANICDEIIRDPHDQLSNFVVRRPVA